MKHVELCNSIHKNESARNGKLHLKLILETSVRLLGSVRGVDPQENRKSASKSHARTKLQTEYVDVGLRKTTRIDPPWIS